MKDPVTSSRINIHSNDRPHESQIGLYHPIDRQNLRFFSPLHRVLLDLDLSKFFQIKCVKENIFVFPKHNKLLSKRIPIYLFKTPKCNSKNGSLERMQ